MLYILTGHIQTGKTRWLQGLIRDLEARDVAVFGVVAPGIWCEHRDGFGGVEYEKLGITNELLPEHEVLEFARREDLAVEQGTFNPHSQSAGAKLKWAIDDDALAKVNGHFADLRKGALPQPERPGFMVVDEFGRLELIVGNGLTEAMETISSGASAYAAHALIIVREMLVDIALERFDNGSAWGGAEIVRPTKSDKRKVLSAFA